MNYIINCSGCGHTVRGEVPLPGRGANIEIQCSNCSYLLAIFEGEPADPK